MTSNPQARVPTPYRHALLDPTGRTGPVPGTLTLGIEVTVPALAERCGLGNVDPQHQPGGGSQAAIEAALDWPLPPAGSTLATIRPDADAFGAMAVLGLRAEGRVLGGTARHRIAAIARNDRFDFGAWPGARPMPPTQTELTAELARGGCAGLIAAIAAHRNDANAGATLARRWITTGRPGARASAKHAAARLLAALATDQVQVTPAIGGRAVVVTSHVPGALSLGYRLAPVVVGFDPGDASAPCRIVVAQWCRGHADLNRALTLLAAAEPGWGGSPTLIGSPQGVTCRTPPEAVLAIIGRCGL
jgi:hypothetical protein